jgi:predicted metal-binding protein
MILKLPVAQLSVYQVVIESLCTGANVTMIVLELPNSEPGTKAIYITCCTITFPSRDYYNMHLQVIIVIDFAGNLADRRKWTPSFWNDTAYDVA